MISPWAAVKDPPHPEKKREKILVQISARIGGKDEDERSIFTHCRAVPSYSESEMTRTAHEFQVQLICLAYDLRGDIGSTEFADQRGGFVPAIPI